MSSEPDAGLRYVMSHCYTQYHVQMYFKPYLFTDVLACLKDENNTVTPWLKLFSKYDIIYYGQSHSGTYSEILMMNVLF